MEACSRSRRLGSDASLPDKINSTILGAAAEHYVMCQLLRRGMIAALAPAGVPDADIIVSDREGGRLAAVQVKARRDIGSDGGWHMKAKHETKEMVRDLLFYCFVDFGKDLDDPPKCWVLPSAKVATALSASYQKWLSMPGKKGQPHKPNDMRRLLPSYANLDLGLYGPGWLDPYRNEWALIACASKAADAGNDAA